MRCSPPTSSLLLIMVFACLSSSTMAAKFNRVVNINDPAPVWAALPGIDGKSHGLADFEKSKAVVVIFTCNHCPVAKSYEDRLMRLATDYARQDVAFVAISVSQLESDNLDAMKKRATDKKYQFPYLQDLSQKSARQYGALCTPHVFLLNGTRRIAYMGAMDDNMYEDRVRESFLKDAIDAVLAGKSPEVTETRPIGCPIDYTAP